MNFLYDFSKKDKEQTSIHPQREHYQASKE